jgi:hypothetical protein
MSDESQDEEVDDSSLPFVLFGLAFAAATIWLLARRRQQVLALHPVGEALSELGPGLGDHRLWLLEGHGQRIDCMIGLARARAAAGRVLICPRPESRPALRSALAGLGSVCWAEMDRPSASQLFGMSEGLRGWGRPLILVEGPGALEPSAPEEDPAAASEEVLSRDLDGMDLLVLLAPDELAGDHPTRSLSPEDLQSLGLQVAGHG